MDFLNTPFRKWQPTSADFSNTPSSKGWPIFVVFLNGPLGEGGGPMFGVFYLDIFEINKPK